MVTRGVATLQKTACNNCRLRGTHNIMNILEIDQGQNINSQSK